MSDIYRSPAWIDGIDETSNSLHELSELAGESVLITGTAGLICSAVADIFIRYNETHNVPIGIIAAGRAPGKMAERFGEFFGRDYFRFVRYDASRPDNEIGVHADYIIHGASNASPKAIMAEPVETMLSNFDGLNFLLRYAKENGAKRLLYISSSEVYGVKNDSDPFGENDYGYIDLLNPRNSYSVGKRAAETLCASYYAEYGVESVIVRPGHIYGPTASPADDRISSAFAYAAARGEKLVMKSAGTQLRSYCHCLDCAAAVVTVLLRGETGQAYNISNSDSVCTIREMAEAMAEAGGVELVVTEATDGERKTYNPMQNSALDAARLTGLSWKGRFDMKNGARRTVETIRDCAGGELQLR